MGLETEIVGEISNVTSIVDLSPDVISQLSLVITLLQTLGGVFIIYLLFSIINIFLNRKKQKELNKITQNLEDIKLILQKKKKRNN